MSSRRTIPLTCAVLASAALTGCGTAVRSQRDEAIPVPQGATWAWGARPGVSRGPRDTAAAEADTVRPRRAPAGEPPGSGATAIVLQRFERAMAAGLQAKGYREVQDPAQADFLLTASYQAGPAVRRGAVGGVGIGIGVGGVWGGRRGRGPWGWYAPGRWGPGIWSSPWAWSPWAWNPWGWGYGMYAPLMWYGPAYAMGPYQNPYGYARRGALTAALRQRSTGYVAWHGEIPTDAYSAWELTQTRVQKLVDKLLRDLP